MSKKKKRNYSYEEYAQQKNNVKKAVKKFNWKLLLKLLGIFTVIFCIYNGVLIFAEKTENLMLNQAALISLVSAVTLCSVVFIIVNKGLSRDIPTFENLPDEWTAKQKHDFISEVEECRKKSKKVLLVLIPLILTLLFDILRVFWF